MSYEKSIGVLKETYEDEYEKWERCRQYRETSSDWIYNQERILKDLEGAIDFLESGSEEIDKLREKKEDAEISESGHRRAIGLLEKELRKAEERIEKLEKIIGDKQ